MIVIDPDAYVDGERTRDALAEAWAWASRDFRDLLASRTIERALVLVGIPGAGKSTWALAQDDDAAVAFDAVNSDPARRASLVRRIREAGKTPIAVWLTTPIEIAVDRNNARSPTRRVPHATVCRCAIALRVHPPTLREGWAEVRRVERFDRLGSDDDERPRGWRGRFYRWRTKGDDRVRPEHRARHGRLFSWDEPPEGGHPGVDYGCRCTPARVSDDDVVVTTGGDLRARPLTVPRWARKRAA